MKAIIIGAGRGRRLMPTTADTPKCYAEVHGRRLLDWTLAAFAGESPSRPRAAAAVVAQALLFAVAHLLPERFPATRPHYS